jgi:hypothetical protein
MIITQLVPGTPATNYFHGPGSQQDVDKTGRFGYGADIDAAGKQLVYFGEPKRRRGNVSAGLSSPFSKFRGIIQEIYHPPPPQLVKRGK